MKLDNLIKLRRKKKISRSKLALDLDVDIDVIKNIETTDMENIDNELLLNIANYFNITVEELTGLYTIDVRTALPKDVALSQVTTLCDELLDKYNIHLDQNKKQTFLAEFKYRIGDLKPLEHTNKDVKLTYIRENSSEFSELLRTLSIEPNDIEELDEDSDIPKVKEIKFLIDKDLNFDKDITKSIRRDAKTIATFYKELLLNDLSEIEAFNILRTFMTCYYDV